MEYTICYRFNGAITIKANSPAEADEKFGKMSMTYLLDNCDDLETTANLTENGDKVSNWD